MATRTVSRRKVRVGAYREAYEHADGGRILFTWPSRNLHWIRGYWIDAIVSDANPADWPRHFLVDLHVLEGLGALILRTERASR
ncbi:hypothetical protein G5V59_00110 [Nocardioides sp. W3-2-3]|nr:hypothetical protein [Nocardioides convexus]